MELRQSLRALLKGSAFAFFWGGGALMSSAVLPVVALLPGSEDARRRRVQRLVQGGFVAFHDYMRATGLIRYDPRETRIDLPDGPCVVIANHPTLIDVTAIMSARGELSCVVKEEHFDGPFIGRLLKLAGHIDGGDGTPLASGAVVHQALERLAAGQPVLIFPEGTRSPALGLGAFHRGAFEIARRSGAPIVPLLVLVSPPTLMKGEPWYELPRETVRLEVRPFDGLEEGDLEGPSRAVAARVEARYRAALEALGRGGAGAPRQDGS